MRKYDNVGVKLLKNIKYELGRSYAVECGLTLRYTFLLYDCIQYRLFTLKETHAGVAASGALRKS